MTHIINARLADMPYLVRKTLIESTPRLYGLLFYLKHPDMIEGWTSENTRQMLVDRADEITDALTTPFLGAETYAELERELAEIQIQLEKE
jgi:hypothetical protein